MSVLYLKLVNTELPLINHFNNAEILIRDLSKLSSCYRLITMIEFNFIKQKLKMDLN